MPLFRVFRSAVVAGVTLFTATWLAAASDYVVVSATATTGYVRDIGDGKLRPESYVFSRGRHFGRSGEDKAVDAQFDQLLQMLAPSLAEQQYWPANGAENADLVIVVHWGETEVYEDPMADYVAEAYNTALAEYAANADEAGNADPGRLNELKRMDSMTSRSVLQSQRTNADLLGYQRSLEKEQQRYFASEDERTMKAELADERYFIVLMAWDYAALRAGEAAHLKWVTRMSVRSAGNRFAEAMPALIKRGESLFGRHSDGLVRQRTAIDRRKAEVEIGETTVVEKPAEAPHETPPSP